MTNSTNHEFKPPPTFLHMHGSDTRNKEQLCPTHQGYVPAVICMFQISLHSSKAHGGLGDSFHSHTHHCSMQTEAPCIPQLPNMLQMLSPVSLHASTHSAHIFSHQHSRFLPLAHAMLCKNIIHEKCYGCIHCNPLAKAPNHACAHDRAVHAPDSCAHIPACSNVPSAGHKSTALQTQTPNVHPSAAPYSVWAHIH